MPGKRILVGGVLLALCVTPVLAADPAPLPPKEEASGPFAAVRMVAYLPFKGVACMVGVLTASPVYWLSGLDPQVQTDTAAVRSRYCSTRYLLEPEWTK